MWSIYDKYADKGSAVAEMGDCLATIVMGRKVGSAMPLFWGAQQVGDPAPPPSNTMWPGPRPTSVPNGTLIHPAIWPHNGRVPKWGGELLCLFWGVGELGPHLTQCGLGRGLPPYQVAHWSNQPFGHNKWAENCGAPFWEGVEAGSLAKAVVPCQNKIIFKIFSVLF